MTVARPRSIVGWVLLVPLAALYLLGGLGKLSGAAAEQFAGWGYAPWFAILIGGLEAAGAVGLLVPRTTRLAVYGLSVIMLGAAYTHLTNGEGVQVVRPGIFLGVLWLVWWLRGTRASVVERPASAPVREGDQ